MSKKKKKISKKKLILYFSGIIAIVLVIFFAIPKEEIIDYATTVVTRSTIEQTVSETGVVKLPKKIDLNFSTSGRLSQLFYEVGDLVSEGAIIAQLNNDSLKIKERELLANLEIAKSTLYKLYSGATTQDIAIAEANVSSAMSAYNSAKNELITIKSSSEESVSQAAKTLNDLWSGEVANITVYEQAIDLAQLNLNNTKITNQKAIDDQENNSLIETDSKLTLGTSALDTIKKILDDSDAASLLSVKNPTYLSTTKSERELALSQIINSRASLESAKITRSREDIGAALDSALKALNTSFSAIKNCFNALENSIISSAFSQTDLNTYKTEVNSHSTSISAAILSVEVVKQRYSQALLSYDTSIQRAEEEYNQARVNYNNAVLQAQNSLTTSKLSQDQQNQSAESRVAAAEKALIIAQVNLKKVKAPANKHDISLAESQIKQAEAAVDGLRQQIKDTQISAPFKATISKINYRIGEQVNPSQNAISLLGESDFEIEVLVSETDIFKVKEGDMTTITLDALGDDIVFSGYVDFIEPAETRIQDVIYYKTKVKFNEKERLIGVKHGMTANIEILTATEKNILTLPSRAILETNGSGKYVQKLIDNQIQKNTVVTGLRGDGGQVEIISGVEEGDEIVLYIKK